MAIFQGDVLGGAVAKKLQLLFCQRAHRPGWRTDVELAADQVLARRHQGPGAKDDIVLDPGPVGHTGAHAHQDAAADLTGVEDGLMAHGDLVAHQQGQSPGAVGPVMGDVEHHAVLDAGAGADADAVDIAADGNLGPDRAVVADDDIAQYHGAGIHPDALAQLRGPAFKAAQVRVVGVMPGHSSNPWSRERGKGAHCRPWSGALHPRRAGSGLGPGVARLLLALAAWLLGPMTAAGPLDGGEAEALTPHQLGVVINDRDPSSLRLGRLYAQLRGIPERNIVELSFDPDEVDLHPGELVLLKQRLDAELPAEVQALALVWTRPWRVGCMSVTSAFALGYDTAYCASGCRPTQAVAYAGSDSRAPWRDFGVRPAMLLAGSDERSVLRLIERGMAADGSRPEGTAYLVVTADARRSVRRQRFAEAATRLGQRLDIEVLHDEALRDRDDVLVYQTGATRVPDLRSNHFLPGALADHLTSLGGQLTGSSQMSALRWLDAGATASYGTVVEPCNMLDKFPDPVLLLESYLAGETAIEAYWKSVVMPGQGVFVGEPLARPWGSASRPSPP